MHIERTGRGRPLLLIHGWAMHGGLFAPLVERLSARHELWLVDLPGHGHSRDDAGGLAAPADLIDQLCAQTPPAVWLGWSLGGLSALQAAQTRAEHLRGLVMLAASPRFVRAPDWPHAVDAAVFQQFGHDLAQDYRGTLDRFLMLEAQGSDDLRAELRLLRDSVYARGEPAPRVLAEGLALLEQGDLRAGLPALRVPSLWIAGRRDRLVPAAGMRDAAAACPGARFVAVDGAGHAPFLTHADAMAADIATFIETCPP